MGFGGIEWFSMDRDLRLEILVCSHLEYPIAHVGMVKLRYNGLMQASGIC
jgi:hypothetical protein